MIYAVLRGFSFLTLSPLWQQIITFYRRQCRTWELLHLNSQSLSTPKAKMKSCEWRIVKNGKFMREMKFSAFPTTRCASTRDLNRNFDFEFVLYPRGMLTADSHVTLQFRFHCNPVVINKQSLSTVKCDVVTRGLLESSPLIRFGVCCLHSYRDFTIHAISLNTTHG